MGNFAFLAYSGYYVYVVDIANPSEPKEVFNQYFPGYVPGGGAYDITGNESYVFVTIYGDTNINNGVHIFDATTPTKPSIGFIPIEQGALRSYYDNGYLYILLNSCCIQIYDVNDINSPSLLSTYTFTPSFGYGEIAVQDNTLFYSSGAGISLIDVSDKTDPQLITREYYGDPNSNSLAIKDDYIFITNHYLNNLLVFQNLGVSILENDSFETGNDPTFWQWNDSCNYLVYNDSEIALDGSRYLATNRNNQDSCRSFYQDVQRVPRENEKYTFGIWVRSSNGATREGEIAIWALGGLEEKSSLSFSVSEEAWQFLSVSLEIAGNDHHSIRAEVYLHSLDAVDYFFDDAGLYGPPTYNISGRITSADNIPLANILVSAGNGVTTRTLSNGNYEFSNLPQGQYTITPISDSDYFSPPSASVTLDSNVNNMDFNSLTNKSTYTISGRITDADGNGLSDASVVVYGWGVTETNNQGYYTLSGLDQGAYNVVPTKSGYNFSPSNFSVNLVSNKNVNFQASPAPTPVLEISHVEVNQSIQNENNDVVLVAGKSALVRAYINCVANCNGNSTITGRLHVNSNLDTLFVYPNPSFVSLKSGEHWLDQRGSPSKSLNFVVPGYAIDPGEVTFSFIVNGLAPEFSTHTFQFEEALTLKVGIQPVKYQPLGCDWQGDLSPSNRIFDGAMYSWFHSAFPFSYVEFVPQNLPLIEPVPLLLGESCQTEFPNDLAQANLLFALSLRNAMASTDIMFGWLPEGATEKGLGNNWLNSAFVAEIYLGSKVQNEFPEKFYFAHEMGHALSLNHTYVTSGEYCASPDLPYDWPYPDSMIQEYGVELQSLYELKSPDMYEDIMSYCWRNEFNAWISPFNYDKAFNNNIALQNNTLSQPPLSELTWYGVTGAGSNYLIGGLIHETGEASFEIIIDDTSFSPLALDLDSGNYCVELRDIADNLLASGCFDLLFIDDVEPFLLSLPKVDGAHQIVLLEDTVVLASRTISSNMPQISITDPVGGEVWSNNQVYTIEWTGSDLDGDELSYTVLYSNNGTDWMPLAVNIADNAITVDAADLPGGTSAKIRVLASDGFQTAFAETEEPFTVESNNPQGFIFAPHDASIIEPYYSIILDGYGYDPEDGALDSSNLSWHSSRDGYLGTGNAIQANLSIGEHTISLVVTDSDGNQTVTDVELYVGLRNYLPFVRR